MKRGTRTFAARAAEAPPIECRTVTADVENQTSKVSEAWVKATDGLKGLKVVFALPFVLVQVSPEAGE
jgi:hypothetical protein